MFTEIQKEYIEQGDILKLNDHPVIRQLANLFMMQELNDDKKELFLESVGEHEYLRKTIVLLIDGIIKDRKNGMSGCPILYPDSFSLNFFGVNDDCECKYNCTCEEDSE